MPDPNDKILPLNDAIIWRKQRMENKERLVISNGCFDLLHRGHMQYLLEARKLGDVLLVAVNSDCSVSILKHSDRPFMSQSDRAYMLASLEAVDAVLVFDETTAVRILEVLRPEIYAKGGDYKENTLNQEEYKLLKEMNCQIHLIPFIEGYSTSRLIRMIKNKEK